MDLFSTNFDYGALLQWDEDDTKPNEVTTTGGTTGGGATLTGPINTNNDIGVDPMFDSSLVLPTDAASIVNNNNNTTTNNNNNNNNNGGLLSSTNNNQDNTINYNSSDLNTSMETRLFQPLNGFISAIADPSTAASGTSTNNNNNNSQSLAASTAASNATANTAATAAATATVTGASPQHIMNADESYRLYTSHLLSGNLFGDFDTIVTPSPPSSQQQQQSSPSSSSSCQQPPPQSQLSQLNTMNHNMNHQPGTVAANTTTNTNNQQQPTPQSQQQQSLYTPTNVFINPSMTFEPYKPQIAMPTNPNQQQQQQQQPNQHSTSNAPTDSSTATTTNSNTTSTNTSTTSSSAANSGTNNDSMTNKKIRQSSSGTIKNGSTTSSSNIQDTTSATTPTNGVESKVKTWSINGAPTNITTTMDGTGGTGGTGTTGGTVTVTNIAGMQFPTFMSSNTTNSNNPMQQLPYTVTTMPAPGHVAMLQQPSQQQQQDTSIIKTNSALTTESDTNKSSNNKQTNSQSLSSTTASAAAPTGTTTATATFSTTTGGAPTATSSGAPPPFHLFDATCELRNNFALAQKAMNLPTVQDNNSFHYGMAVNGFHPQLNAQHNPIPTQLSSSSSSLLLPHVKLLDVRSTREAGKNSSRPDRNEREQQRAHKITELIKELRGTMIRGGWKIEMKSKYQTLSSCADYMKHLIKLTKEKEEAVQKAQADLTTKQQKLEEEKALQEFRSDRDDSVTSDMTMTTSTQPNYSTEESFNATSSDSHGKKRKSVSITYNGVCSKDCQDHHHHHMDKKCKSSIESGNTSSGNDSGNDGNTTNPTTSSVDQSTSPGGEGGTTDGNGSGNNGQSLPVMNQELTNSEDAGNSSEGATASDAVAVSGIDIGSDECHHQTHLDSIIQVKGKPSSRKRQLTNRVEKTSLDNDFELNYQEVFLASNVPQLIATTSGRIVTCNKFFYRVTGLTQYEVKQVTIFSLVQVDMLPFLYAFVAERLREVPSKETISDNAPLSSADKKDLYLSNSSKTITLPAVKFPKRMAPSKNPLYVTLTFMIDRDPSKCCIHCAMTDTSGTNGKIGPVTSELLNTMYSTQNVSKYTKI